MRPRLLELLACPACYKPFDLVILDGTADEVEAGLLLCRCGATYPVVGSIPRILPDALAQHPDFVRRYVKEIERHSRGRLLLGGLPFDERQKPTQKSFGYQWTVFGEMVEEFREHFLNYIYPPEPSMRIVSDNTVNKSTDTKNAPESIIDILNNGKNKSKKGKK